MTGTDSAGAAVVVGVDFGTLSGRAVVVRVGDGAELGSAVTAYAHAVVDRVLPATGRPLPPDWALQVPADYVDVLRDAVPRAVAAAGIDPGDVVGIGTDFTACTVLPVLADGTRSASSPSWRTGRMRTSSCGSTTRHRARPTASTEQRHAAARRRPVDPVGGPRPGPAAGRRL